MHSALGLGKELRVPCILPPCESVEPVMQLNPCIHLRVAVPMRPRSWSEIAPNALRDRSERALTTHRDQAVLRRRQLTHKAMLLLNCHLCERASFQLVAVTRCFLQTSFDYPLRLIASQSLTSVLGIRECRNRRRIKVPSTSTEARVC